VNLLDEARATVRTRRSWAAVELGEEAISLIIAPDEVAERALVVVEVRGEIATVLRELPTKNALIPIRERPGRHRLPTLEFDVLELSA